jgi:GAF domain-containing protein
MIFTPDQYPGWAELASGLLMHIDDVETDLRISDESRLSYQALNIQALALEPLEVAGRPIGALLFGSPERRTHNEREMRIYGSLAELTTIALENIRLLDQTRSRARQLQTSAEVSRAVTSILDINELLPRVVDLIRDNFGYDHVQVFLLNAARDSAVLKASTGEVGRTMIDLNWALAVGSDSVIGQVTSRAVPVVALDTADAKVVHRPNPYLPDTRSELAVPLISRGQVAGALDVQSNRSGAFSEEDVTVLSSLADQIAIALDNARLFEETQDYTLALSEQVHSLQGLLDASQGFTSMYEADDILRSAAHYLVELMGVDHSGIVIADEADPQMGVVRAEYPATGAVGVRLRMLGPGGTRGITAPTPLSCRTWRRATRWRRIPARSAGQQRPGDRDPALHGVRRPGDRHDRA